MFADTLENLVASSKTANAMVQEAKIMQQLLAATDVDVVLVDNMVEDAMKTAASTKYMKDPQNIEGYNVCPVVLQYNNYKKSINDMLKQLESSSTVDPNSNRYKGPTSYRRGTCGVPKFLNFNGVNKIDYYPPKYCVPDVTEDGAPIIVENIYSSKQNVAVPTFNVEFDKVMTINVRGVHLATKAAVPAMIRAGGGKIVNIASGTFYYGPPGLSHYTASKGAVIALTRSHARELGDKNIQINAIAPGLTESEALQGHTGFDPARAPTIQSRSIKRAMMPEDLLGSLMYLITSDSDFVTGQTLNVDGGKVNL